MASRRSERCARFRALNPVVVVGGRDNVRIQGAFFATLKAGGLVAEEFSSNGDVIYHVSDRALLNSQFIIEELGETITQENGREAAFEPCPLPESEHPEDGAVSGLSYILSQVVQPLLSEDILGDAARHEEQHWPHSTAGEESFEYTA